MDLIPTTFFPAAFFISICRKGRGNQLTTERDQRIIQQLYKSLSILGSTWMLGSSNGWSFKGENQPTSKNHKLFSHLNHLNKYYTSEAMLWVGNMLTFC